jgi:hypothetical protein
MRQHNRQLSRRVGTGVGEGKSQDWDGVWEFGVLVSGERLTKDLGIGRVGLRNFDPTYGVLNASYR